MAVRVFFFFSLLLLLLCSSLSGGWAEPHPPLLTTITKDPATLCYTASVQLASADDVTSVATTAYLLVDLSSMFTWLSRCSSRFNSTSSASKLLHAVPCRSSLCPSLQNAPSSPKPGGFCGGPTCASVNGSSSPCTVLIRNPVVATRCPVAASAVISDSVLLPTTDGHNPGPLSSIPRYLFACSDDRSLMKGLPKRASGVLSLSRSVFSLPAQLAAGEENATATFSLCLSGSPSAPGVAFFGTRGPFFFLPQTNLDSQSLTYTPLLPNLGVSGEYFIGVTGIRVDGKAVPLDPMLLSGRGTKLSAVEPYTAMRTPIYRAFVTAFVEAAARMNLSAAGPAVRPFEVCYASEGVGGTRTGPLVPEVELVLNEEGAAWRISGGNSMVWAAGGEYLCLGFVDGGNGRRTSRGVPAIVVGGYQMEDNLVQFDLERERVGFSSSLLGVGTSCANFNLTPSSSF